VGHCLLSLQSLLTKHILIRQCLLHNQAGLLLAETAYVKQVESDIVLLQGGCSLDVP